MIAGTRRLRDAGLPQERAEAVTLAIHAGVTGGGRDEGGRRGA